MNYRQRRYKFEKFEKESTKNVKYHALHKN